MNTLFILNEAPYGSERSYNGLRLAGALAKRAGATVRVFLMGDAATCAKRGQVTPDGYYNVNRMLRALALHRSEVGVCGTCMNARGMTDEELLDGTKRSTLDELVEWTESADQVIVF